MKPILALMLTLATIACQANSLKQPNVLQIHYSPTGWAWGDSDDEFFQDETTYERYDLAFDHAFAGRLIIKDKYVSYSQYIGELDEGSSATVDSLAVGVALNATTFDPGITEYLIGNFGLGVGHFDYLPSQALYRELFAEVGAEAGFKLHDHVLVGAGLNFKVFGHPGETKAHWFDIYLSTSVMF